MQNSFQHGFIWSDYLCLSFLLFFGHELWHWWLLSSLLSLYMQIVNGIFSFMWTCWTCQILFSINSPPKSPKGRGVPTSGNFHDKTSLSPSQEWQTFRHTADGTSTNADVDESIYFLGYLGIPIAELLWYIEFRQTTTTSADLTLLLV